jgi:hypothetical protein
LEVSLALPCKHIDEVVEEVQPTIDLLTNLDILHPDVLLTHKIQPVDYKQGLVFRSAVESIRGRYIASSTRGREGLVKDVLENLKQREKVTDYKHKSSRERFDFEVQLEQNPDTFIAVEVKGGEGNSINISERPLWAKEFYVWSHLDGAIVNQPAHGAHSIINRITNELISRRKHVDALFFKDILCGTRTRPCPKYPGKESTIGLMAAPDIFLFPNAIPTLENPSPPVHNLESLKLPNLIFDLFNVPMKKRQNHVWEVHVRALQGTNKNISRETEIWHLGQIVDKSRSRL